MRFMSTISIYSKAYFLSQDSEFYGVPIINLKRSYVLKILIILFHIIGKYINRAIFHAGTF